ncbi:MAG: HDOD domain-containing protein [bacterium]
MSTLSEPDSFMLRLEQAEDLPILPQVHAQAMMIAQNPESNIGELKDILKYDPALTATILKIANSAYYGFSHRIESLQTALVMLGLREVTRLLVTAAIVHTFPTEKMPPRFQSDRFWLHSVSTGLLAQYLVNKLKLATNADVFTGGLLHDLGRVLLAAHFPTEYNKVLTYSIENKVTPRMAERQVLGIDHSAIGGYLSTRWELPEALEAMIRYHHAPYRENANYLDVAIVHLSNRISKHHGMWLNEGDVADDSYPLLEDPAWNVISGQVWPSEMSPQEFVESTKEEADRASELLKSLLST